jgi:hypothetical protein
LIVVDFLIMNRKFHFIKHLIILKLMIKYFILIILYFGFFVLLMKKEWMILLILITSISLKIKSRTFLFILKSHSNLVIKSEMIINCIFKRIKKLCQIKIRSLLHKVILLILSLYLLVHHSLLENYLKKLYFRKYRRLI